MDTTIAVVRQAVERVAGVSKTWFEWTMEKEDFFKTLVVEVSFDTDPNSPGYDRSAIEEIGRVAKDALANETTMVVSYLRIVPATFSRSRRSPFRTNFDNHLTIRDGAVLRTIGEAA